MSRFHLPQILVLLALSVATGCNQSPRQEVSRQQLEKINVVATFLPIYWFSKAVAGDLAQVEVLIPPGAEVHEYQATPGNVQAIAQADVLVKNGIGFEEFLAGTVKNAGNTKLIEIDSSLGLENLFKDGNPHIWLDPVLAIQQVANIRDGLIAADPKHKATYQANAAAYIQQMEALDREFKQRLEQYPNCTFVTFHNAYLYLANRYGLKQVAVVEIPEDQLSPRDVQKAVEAVKQYKVKTVLGEPGVDNKLLQSLSQDLKLTFRSVDPLEAGSLDPQHYFSAMKANLQNLESACR